MAEISLRSDRCVVPDGRAQWMPMACDVPGMQALHKAANAIDALPPPGFVIKLGDRGCGADDRIRQAHAPAESICEGDGHTCVWHRLASRSTRGEVRGVAQA
jgi:hypothetical protein